jgi:hypothetical protein
MVVTNPAAVPPRGLRSHSYLTNAAPARRQPFAGRLVALLLSMGVLPACGARAQGQRSISHTFALPSGTA